MANQGFEEWDDDFLDQLVQAEEHALSSATQRPPPPPPLSGTAPPYAVDVSYSPPRELSQRVVHEIAKGSDHSSGQSYSLAKDQEIDRLKKELGRVSKQLSQLEQECLKLRKGKDKKEEQLKGVHSRIVATVAEPSLENTNFGRGHGVNIRADPQTSLECQVANFSDESFHPSINVGTSACKDVGVQTDNGEATNGAINCKLPATYHCSKKLINLWDSTNGSQSGRILASKLLASCEEDFPALFGYMNLNLPYKGKTEPLYESNMSLVDRLQSGHSAEAAKISHLYSKLIKFSEETGRLGDILEALVALCRLEHVSIVHRSLHILHVLLKYSFSGTNCGRRNNVMVEEPCSNNSADEHKYPIAGSMFYALTKETSDGNCNFHRPEPSDMKTLWKSILSHSSVMSICHVNWISLFELMCQIVRRNTEEYVRLEAVCIMNLILIRSNAYMEREKFASEVVFQSMSQLLRKEAGPPVQTQALRLLYLLLNCPKVMAMFSSVCKEEVESAGNTADTNANNISAFQSFSVIFEGLAECIACKGTGAQELKLRRNAITFLAFLASSGKSSLEILFSPDFSKMTYLLATILRGLTSDMALEELDPAQPPEVFKERTLLMRETLILLNRLVSHPRYSGPFLRSLTSRRDMASLTIDVAKRLSVKRKCLTKDDIITMPNRESEILELARSFKKRVFTFLESASREE